MQEAQNEKLRASGEERLQAAQTILDRVGLGKTERVDVNHNVQGGLFILPAKQETLIVQDA